MCQMNESGVLDKYSQIFPSRPNLGIVNSEKLFADWMSNESQHKIRKLKRTEFSFGIDSGNFTLGNINDYTVCNNHGLG